MDLNFSKIEKKILKFWKDNQIFEKSIEQRKRTSNFVFYEGPPYANAKPGIHHLLARAFKDIICRYKTMRGFKVLRKAGWDTHGLPTEMEVEKKLGIKSKKEIEKLGIKKFIEECKKNVFTYKKEWEKFTERIAFWLDLENPYITCDNNYIESVWWILKQIYQKGLLCQDYKVSPYCSRCQTVLSSHEVAQGYEKVKEPAIYIKFPILNPEFKNTSLLVWTTTPWTLPGNVAIAVNPNFDYVKICVNPRNYPRESASTYLILAKERIGAVNFHGEIVREFKGKDLVGLRYQALYPFNEEVIKKSYRVIPADFVSLEEGTGLVHIAPAFGEEDMTVGKKNNLPTLLTVDEEGKFKLEVKKWARMFVKEADPLIIEDLKKRNFLFKEELYEHDYPFCWRCSSPLLYYAKKSWFIRMTKVKKDLIRNNQKINWIPGHLKKGRFGEWLREIKDWALSRERYWGTPLPIWQCQIGKNQKPKTKNQKYCGNTEVIDSLNDLLKQKFSTNNYYLFRHGHSLRQTKKLASCWPEKPSYYHLTEKGETEVLASAKKIKKKKIDLIFSSDLVRTKESAEILAKEIGVKIIFDKKLREVNVGIFNDRDPKLFWDYIFRKKNPYLTKIPKGESLRDLQKRVYDFLKEIDKKYQKKNILIVSHELPLTILENTLKGWEIKKIIEWRRENRDKLLKTGQFQKIEFKNLPFNEKGELDFHRPYIDEVKFYCPGCKEGLMVRTPEVIDCWFDSGSMPFAQAHYPFAFAQNQKFLFPADYISEGVDQTRGWFYTLLAISTLLGKGPAYKNVISLGHVLDEKGEKMSKSKGNVVNPWYIVEKYGADATRWYFYTVNQPGDSKLFSEKDTERCLKKFILTFWNSFAFYQTYRESQKPALYRTEGSGAGSKVKSQKSKDVLDQWILSRLNNLIQETTRLLDKYDVTAAARVIENFVINDLSLWYIRRSRKRFKEAAATLNFVLLTLSKLTAPFTPFLSEKIYRCSSPGDEHSVHLTDWPKGNKKLINRKLERKMERARELVSLTLAERAKAAIKVRQPLSKLKIKDKKLKINDELINLIKEEVNVKEIVFDDKIKEEVELETKITPELKEEGIVREVIRQIQEMRKKLGLKPRDKISIRYSGTPDLNKILIKNENFILQETKAKDFLLKSEKLKEKFDLEEEKTINQENLWLALTKL